MTKELFNIEAEMPDDCYLLRGPRLQNVARLSGIPFRLAVSSMTWANQYKTEGVLIEKINKIRMDAALAKKEENTKYRRDLKNR